MLRAMSASRASFSLSFMTVSSEAPHVGGKLAKNRVNNGIARVQRETGKNRVCYVVPSSRYNARAKIGKSLCPTWREKHDAIPRPAHCLRAFLREPEIAHDL